MLKKTILEICIIITDVNRKDTDFPGFTKIWGMVIRKRKTC